MTRSHEHPVPGGAATSWPAQVADRIRRIYEFHQSTKLSEATIHQQLPLPEPPPEPPASGPFDSLPKLELPTSLVAVDVQTLSLLNDARDALIHNQIDPVHDIRTLATWLYLADGLVRQAQRGGGVSWHRTVPSNAQRYPCEIYVLALDVGAIEPGFYHYSPRDFALRKLRDGESTLAQLRLGGRGSQLRREFDFLLHCPAAVLVSSVFSRSTRYWRQRGYRAALLDAGHLIENLVQTGTALGMELSVTLNLPAGTMRRLIGLGSDPPFEHAEAVHAMLAWGQRMHTPLAPGLPPPPEPMPLLARPTPTSPVEPMPSVWQTQEDCVAGSDSMIIEILPPLTELTPLPANMPAYERPMVQEPQGGLPLLTLLTRRPRARAFHQQPIPRDAVLAISRLSLRGGTYYPLRPDGRHAGLVRPFWIIHQVTGMDPGIWYYDPVTDRWTQLSRGRFRLDAAYLSADHPAAMNAAAICFLMVNLNHLLVHAGPDVYRLAHLEAGIVAHRMDLTAAALDLGAVLNARFFDDDARRFFGLEHTGWEFLYEVMFGVPDDQFHPPPPTIAVPEEEQSQQ